MLGAPTKTAQLLRKAKQPRGRKPGMCARRALAACVWHQNKTARRWRRGRRTGCGASAAQKRQEAQEVQPANTDTERVGVARAVNVRTGAIALT
eukprot:scaffold12564_cov45-Phaeocystis_antarctica.AAC.1